MERQAKRVLVVLFSLAIVLAAVDAFCVKPYATAECKSVLRGAARWPNPYSDTGWNFSVCWLAAEHDDIDAQIFVAEDYHQRGSAIWGSFLAQFMADDWFHVVERALTMQAGAGDPAAQYKLGYFYEHSMLKNMDKAQSWYAAAGKTIAPGDVNLGELRHVCSFRIPFENGSGCFE